MGTITKQTFEIIRHPHIHGSIEYVETREEGVGVMMMQSVETAHKKNNKKAEKKKHQQKTVEQW